MKHSTEALEAEARRRGVQFAYEVRVPDVAGKAIGTLTLDMASDEWIAATPDGEEIGRYSISMDGVKALVGKHTGTEPEPTESERLGGGLPAAVMVRIDGPQPASSAEILQRTDTERVRGAVNTRGSGRTA